MKGIMDATGMQMSNNDDAESGRLYDSCKSSGFFLLELRGCEEGEVMLNQVDSLFDMAEELYDMPLEEKKQYALRPGTAFGYKGIGVSKIDSKGTPDRCEFWGVSKDEILGQASNPCPMPPIFIQNISLLQGFAKQSHSICTLVLTHLEAHLHLPQEALTSLHRLSALSADQLRTLKMAAQPAGDQRTSLLAHTDFGSITLLWNILGGLQILPPEAGDSDPDCLSDAWQFVQPQRGCVVVNVGDALVSFTNGVLRSNLHRVTAPPGKQGEFERYSAAYFMRPEEDVIMQPLKGGDIVPPQLETLGEKLYTSKEWVGRRADESRRSGMMKSSGGNLLQL